MPTISCIMPVYNTAKYLDEAIQSILNQTFTDFEFIISDDGSTDGSKEIIKKYAEKDSRIIFLDNPINRGICANLNDMTKISNGEYIAFMESDDISMPERFQIIMSEFKNDKSLSLVGTQGELIAPDGSKIEDFSDMNYDFSEFQDRYLFKYTFNSPSVIFKKTILNITGDFESKLLWDFNFYSFILFSGLNVKNIPYKGIKKREHQGSLQSRKLYAITNEYLKLRLLLIRKFHLSNHGKYLIMKSYIMWIYYIISGTGILFTKKIGIYRTLSPLWRKYILRNT